jgi:retron-type reverse transcriptase
MDWLRRLVSGSRSAEQEPTTGVATVEDLAERLGRSSDELRIFVPAYREFSLPKRSGGTRRITAPDPSTRALQRAIARRILAGARAHPAAFGFERGRSTVAHASHHAGRAVVLRMDIEDFFGSTTTERVRRYFRYAWDADAAVLLSRLTTHDGALPQGAPTSPKLSTQVNVRLDARLEGFAASRGARYSRYADDLTFSLPEDDGRIVHELIRFTDKVLRQAGYRMHRQRKLHVRRRHERQIVTGLVVNGAPRLPRERRRWLRAVEHRIATGAETTLTEQQLAGWRAYQAMVESGTGAG